MACENLGGQSKDKSNSIGIEILDVNWEPESSKPARYPSRSGYMGRVTAA